MTKHEIIQLTVVLIGGLCYGVLFNIRGKRLVASALGGFLAWGLLLLMRRFDMSEPVNYFIVAALISTFSEIMARVLKTPAAPIAIASLIPLIPGRSLYYTMAYAFESDFNRFLEKAVYTLSLSSALALGIILAAAAAQLFFKPKACTK